jgi:ABC-type uncharacterized transport system fused permease/ATPase subunit
MENETPLLSTIPIISTSSRQNETIRLLYHAISLISHSCKSISILGCIFFSIVLQCICSYLSFKSQLLLSGVVGAVLDNKQNDALVIVGNASVFYATLASLQIIGAFFSEHVRLSVRVHLGLFLHKSYFGKIGRPYRMIYRKKGISTTTTTNTMIDRDDKTSSPQIRLDNIDLRITQDVDQLCTQVCTLFLGSYAIPSSALGTIVSICITFAALFSTSTEQVDNNSATTTTTTTTTTGLPIPALLLALLLFVTSALVSHLFAIRVAKAFYKSDSAFGTLRFVFSRIRLYYEEICLLNGQVNEAKYISERLIDAYKKTRYLYMWQFVQTSFSSFSSQAPYLLAYAVAIFSLPLYVDTDGGVNVSAVSASISISGQFIASITTLPYLYGQIATLTGYLKRVSDLLDAFDDDIEEDKTRAQDIDNDNKEMNESSSHYHGPPLILHFDTSSSSSSSSSFTNISSSSSLELTRVPLVKGQSVHVTGPSGCGKTTSLRFLAGLERRHEVLHKPSSTSLDDCLFIPQRAFFPAGTLYDGIIACATTRVTNEIINSNKNIGTNHIINDTSLETLKGSLKASNVSLESRVFILTCIKNLQILPMSSSSWISLAISLITNPTRLFVVKSSILSPDESFSSSSSSSASIIESIPSRSEIASLLVEIGLSQVIEKSKLGLNNTSNKRLDDRTSVEEDEEISCDWMQVLSAGELQLLLIASAILLHKQSPTTLSTNNVFVFLDEATSALDKKTKEKVFFALDKIGVTVIYFGHDEYDDDLYKNDKNELRYHFFHTIQVKMPMLMTSRQVIENSISSSSSSSLIDTRNKALNDATWIHLERDDDIRNINNRQTVNGHKEEEKEEREGSQSIFQCIFTVLCALSPSLNGIYNDFSLIFFFSSSQQHHMFSFSSLISPESDVGFILVLIGVLFTSISLSLVSVQVAFIPGAIFDAIVAGNTVLAWNWFLYAFIVYLLSAILGSFSRTLGKFVALSSFYRLVKYFQQIYLQPGKPILVEVFSENTQKDHEPAASVSSVSSWKNSTSSYHTRQSHVVPPLWDLHKSSSSSSTSSSSPSSSSSYIEKTSASLDSLDQRLIGDTLSLTTSLCTVLFGGDNKLSLIQVLSTVIATSVTTSVKFGSSLVFICYAFAALSVIVSAVSSRKLSQAIALVALAEGILRSGHARVRSFAEEIGFLRLEKNEHEKADINLLSVAAVGINAIFIELTPRLLNNIFALCGTAVAYAIVCYGATVKDASSLFGLVNLLGTLIMYLTSFPGYYTAYVEACGYLRRVADLLLAINKQKSNQSFNTTDRMTTTTTSSSLSDRNGISTDTIIAIDVCDIQSSHVQWKKTVSPLHFSLKRGDVLKVIGASAVGKSSFLKALLGFDCLNNKPPLIRAYQRIEGYTGIQQEGVLSHMQLFAIVPQRVYIQPFGSSLADNIAYPSTIDMKNKASGMKVVDILISVGLLYLLDQYKDKEKDKDKELDPIDSFRNEDKEEMRYIDLVFRHDIDWSSTLSGGERQRIAISRLMYSKPSFALLDESFNALPMLEGQRLIKLLSDKQTYNIGLVVISSN